MDYNSKEGIETQLGSYEAFYELMQERRLRGGGSPFDGTAGEDHGKLTPFVLLGRFFSDAFGSCDRLDRRVFTDEDRNTMPKIMTPAEFKMYIRDHFDAVLYPVCEDAVFHLPPPHTVCANCQGDWTLDNCHDIESIDDYEDCVYLALLVGQTIGEFRQSMAQRKDGVWTFHGTPCVHNPNNPLIENSVWRSEADQRSIEVTDDYVIKHGDTTALSVMRFYHRSCFEHVSQARAVKEADDQMNELTEWFEQSGFTHVSYTRAPLPDHLCEMLQTVMGGGLSFDDAREYSTYFRVETDQGSFGIVPSGDQSILDLEGTGVTHGDLHPNMRAHIASDHHQNLTVLTGDERQVLRLWQQLVIKGAAEKSKPTH